ncbi:MAG: DUF1571 domain-containing protein [Gemmataceae bacterium]
MMMVRNTIAVFLVAAFAAIGCVRNRSGSDDDRYRGSMPASRSRDLAKAEPKAEPKIPATPPNINPPTLDEKPVVPVDFNRDSSLLASPMTVVAPAAPVAAPGEPAGTDDPTQLPRPIRGIIQKRRDERNEKAAEAVPETKKEDKPMLPSPFAKDRKDEPNGVEFPSPVSSNNPKLAEVRRVYMLAKKKWGDLTDYESKLVRREVIGGKEMPAEEMLFQFRKEPYSVRTKNTGSVGKGREIIYVAGPGAKVHILTGEGDNRLVGAGFYTVLSPDDRMITSKSRHKINEGAIGRTVELLGKALAMAEAGKFDGLKSMGKVKRREYADPVEGIEAVIPPGQDAELPKGGRREVYFDATPTSPSYGLPVLIRLIEGDRELEYYCFSEFKVPANLTNADFDPARMTKKK